MCILIIFLSTVYNTFGLINIMIIISIEKVALILLQIMFAYNVLTLAKLTFNKHWNLFCDMFNLKCFTSCSPVLGRSHEGSKKTVTR